MLGDVDELLRCELQHEGHDADVGAELLHRTGRLGTLQRRELEDLQPLLRRGDLHGVGLGTLLLRRDEDSGYGVATREECLEDGFPEILLTDDGYFHVFPKELLGERR